MKLWRWLILLFFCLLIVVSVFPVLGFDVYFSHLIQNIHMSFFSYLMSDVSYLGDSIIFEGLISTTVVFLLIINWKIEALITLMDILSGTILGVLFKDIANRPRPASTLVNAYKIFPDKSFPSLHVVTYTVFFGYMLYLACQKIKNKVVKILVSSVSIFFIGLVGLSRIYLGAHWLTDVLGGYLLGAIILLVIIDIDKSFSKNVKR